MTEQRWVCTDDGCEASTEAGCYLCEECLDQVMQRVEKISDLLPALRAIAAGHEKAFVSPTAEKHGNDMLRAPINLTALVLEDDLAEWADWAQPAWTREALRRDPEARKVKADLLRAVDQADVMVNGAEEEIHTEDYVRFRLSQMEPLPASEAAATLSEKLGTPITIRQIYKWRMRGRLEPVMEPLRRVFSPEELQQMKKKGQALPPARPRYRLIDIYEAWLNRGRTSWTPNYDKRTPPPRIAYTRPMR